MFKEEKKGPTFSKLISALLLTGLYFITYLVLSFVMSVEYEDTALKFLIVKSE